MTERLKTFLLSFLVPGLGYLQNGDRKSFFRTVIFFLSVLLLGIAFRLFTSFWSFLFIFFVLISIYIVTAIDATLKLKAINQSIRGGGFLKLFFTITFLLVTAFSFANRRTIMGFDIMSMEVSVMQPTILKGEKFLIDTWAYKKISPKRKDIVVHSFYRQAGFYLNRIIAIENDRIEIKNGIVFLNGQVLDEPYVFDINVRKQESKNMKAFRVQGGQYFVMGDNRDASFGDSRFSGTITIDNIVGKATDVIYSHDKSRFGTPLK